MASVFGHGMVAYTISRVSSEKVSKGLVVLAMISAILPDIDVLAFKFGIPYEHMFGHRGFTHSILFAVVWAIGLSLLFGKKTKLLYAIVLFLSTISHGILDAMTSGGRGVGFFIPFVNERYFFSFRGIKVSPIGIDKFFSKWGAEVILSELKYIVIPCIIILISFYLKRSYFK
ncbi:hypothetical protein A9Q87_06270 [Flavobacteriales bacterium 34_180_T64]|nr:hypothetical protein A9Q87_06270 [Flavobacteriales bacterium 34_180_T64]